MEYSNIVIAMYLRTRLKVYKSYATKFKACFTRVKSTRFLPFQMIKHQICVLGFISRLIGNENKQLHHTRRSDNQIIFHLPFFNCYGQEKYLDT